MTNAIGDNRADAARPVLGRAWKWARRDPELALGILLAFAVLYVVALPGTLTSYSPYAIDVPSAMQPPSAAHIFGTDDTGRDIYARVLYGARVTLGIVAGSLFVSGVIGSLLGLIAGFHGRVAELVSGRLVDVILSFPPVVLGVMITGILGPSGRNLVVALVLMFIPIFFRIARSGTVTETEKTYVQAARALGVAEHRILLFHVGRNVVPIVFLQYMIAFPIALQVQAALGFLGLGVQPPTPDWGSILQQAKDLLFAAPWMSVFPGVFIIVSALAVILIGRGLQRRAASNQG